ncbi:ankyrin [Elysia marginata]|uniref:Ankyrin n=1 Tax=Elysia marginata TaxID=1093978 RepID=A0AAV4JU88_9GAST|nr:ankyrin [Elysia marginata]
MGNRKLIKAIRKQDIQMVKRMLASGRFAIDGDDSVWNPPIIEAVYSIGEYDHEDEDSKRCELVELLVRHGADLNVLSVRSYPDEMTAAVIAAERGYLKCLQFLTERGADLSIAREGGYTALIVAAREGHADCVQYLARHMSPSLVNHVTTNGNTALRAAVLNSHERWQRAGRERVESGQRAGIACLRYIIDAGADLNVEFESQAGNTALFTALEKRRTAAATLLLEKGAHVNTVTHDGKTPLTVAGAGCFPILLRHGLNPTMSRQDRYCLHAAVREGSKADVRALVRNGFPPLYFGDTYMPEFDMPYASPLVMAICYRQPEIAKYLITNRFFTHYDIARLCWEPEIRKILSANASHIENGDREGATQCMEIVDFLSTKLPPSLQGLCLVAISSALSADFAHEPTQHDRWLFRPTFIERVHHLDIPCVLKDALLQKTPLSEICCRRWGDIDLEDVESLSVCGDCAECAGEVVDQGDDSDDENEVWSSSSE